MEATTEKNEYKLKDFLLDVFAKYKINIKKQDFDTILILEEDNKEFRAGRDLEADTEIYQKDIEQEFKVSRATASNMLQLMERKGLIVRESVSCDARLKKISLTEKAKNMVAKSDADIREMEQLITKGFHKEETEQLKHYLDRIMENIGVAEDCCGRKCKSGAKEQKNHNI